MTLSPKTSPLLLALALTLAAALPPVLAAETVKGVPLDGAFRPAEQAHQVLKINDAGAAALKNIKRAAISSFQVEFVTKGAASASSHELGRSGRAGTNVVVTLVGVDGAAMQAMTDKLHADFIADLSAQGIDVLPTERVLAAPSYQKMAAGGSPGPTNTRTKNTWSTVYAPAGLAVYGVGSASTGGGLPLLTGLSAFSAVAGTIFGNADLQRELDATVINVRLVVNFVDMKSSDSSWFARSSGTATVSMRYSPSIAPAQSFMSFHQADGGGMLTLHAPLLIDTAAFKEVKDTSSVAANVGLALLSMAIGNGGSQTAIDKEVVADPEQYPLLVGAAAGTLREMFMERVRAAR